MSKENPHVALAYYRRCVARTEAKIEDAVKQAFLPGDVRQTLGQLRRELAGFKGRVTHWAKVVQTLERV